MTRVLRGITWDHARGYDPLARGVAGFTALHPDITVEWTRRSLRDFGVEPVERLAERFDLLVIDHPFSGRAAETGCLVDLDTLLEPAFHAVLEGESVGPSTRSYRYGGGVWALPTDAACQVASYRPDLLDALGLAVPRSMDEVIRLAEAARRAERWIALPACQSDAACLVATLAANLGSPIPAEGEAMLPLPVFDAVLDLLERLIRLAHPRSSEWNPIRTYDAMSATDDIVYVPFGFGYTNYARKGVTTPIRFTTIAGPGADPAAGAILGGAGMAVSARCVDRDAAAAYLRYVHEPAHQRGAYFANGGQPGLRAAWTDAANDAAAGGFFSGTLATIDRAYLRPRFSGFIPAFEFMGELVHRHLADVAGDGRPDRKAVIGQSLDTFARARAAAPI